MKQTTGDQTPHLNPSDSSTHLAKALVRRIFMAQVLHRFLWNAAIFLFAWGLVVLVLRFTTELPRIHLLWGALGLLPIFALSVWWERRNRPTTQQAIAFIDSEHNCGGVLMSEGVAGADAWQKRLPPLSVPTLRWNPRTPMLALLVGAAFLSAGFLFPENMKRTEQAADTLQIESVVEEIEAQIEILEETELIEPEQAEALQEQLEQIASDAEASDPMKTWEALDQLEQILEDAKSQSIEEALATLEDLSEAGDFAENIEALADEIAKDPQAAQAAMEKLAEMMENENVQREMAEMGKEMQELAEKINEAAQNGDMAKQEELKEIAKKMSEQKQKLMEKLSQCQQGGMCNSQQMSDAEKAAQKGAGEALKEFLEQAKNSGREQEWQDEMEQQMGESEGGGKGGVDRGPGHANLNYSNFLDENDITLKPKMLSAQELADVKDSKLLGMTSQAPEAGDTVQAQTGALTESQAGGGAANTQRIYPRHRKVVERYFERETP